MDTQPVIVNKIRRLEAMFPDAKKLATQQGAARRIVAIEEFLRENKILHFVMEFPDGYHPVAVLSEHNQWCVSYLIDAGFCVTNA